MSIISWLTAFIEFLNSNNGIITALATALLAYITWRYVRLMKTYVQLTQENVQLTQEILKATNKPEVILYLSPEVGTMNLCIENIGVGYASNIKFTVDYPPNQLSPSGVKFENSDICKNGIDYLGREHKEKVLLFFLDDILNLPNIHSISLSHTRTPRIPNRKKHSNLKYVTGKTSANLEPQKSVM